jgi:hypothetical protein
LHLLLHLGVWLHLLLQLLGRHQTGPAGLRHTLQVTRYKQTIHSSWWMWKLKNLSHAMPETAKASCTSSTLKQQAEQPL